MNPSKGWTPEQKKTIRNAFKVREVLTSRNPLGLSEDARLKMLDTIDTLIKKELNK